MRAVSGYRHKVSDQQLIEAVDHVLSSKQLDCFTVDTQAGKVDMRGMPVTPLILKVQALTGRRIGEKQAAIRFLESHGYDVWTHNKGSQRPMLIVTPRRQLRVVSDNTLRQTG